MRHRDFDEAVPTLSFIELDDVHVVISTPEPDSRPVVLLDPPANWVPRMVTPAVPVFGAFNEIGLCSTGEIDSRVPNDLKPSSRVTAHPRSDKEPPNVLHRKALADDHSSAVIPLFPSRPWWESANDASSSPISVTVTDPVIGTFEVLMLLAMMPIIANAAVNDPICERVVTDIR